MLYVSYGCSAFPLCFRLLHFFLSIGICQYRRLFRVNCGRNRVHWTAVRLGLPTNNSLTKATLTVIRSARPAGTEMLSDLQIGSNCVQVLIESNRMFDRSAIDVPLVGLAAQRCSAEIGLATQRCSAEIGLAIKRRSAEIGLATQRCSAEIGLSAQRCSAEIGLSASAAARRSMLTGMHESQ